MTEEPPQNLEQLIRACGEGWLIDLFAPKEGALDYLRGTLRAVNEEARRRGLELDLSEAALLAAYKSRAVQISAFLQALGATREPAMLVMVWRIQEGMTVSHVSMEYENMKSFSLRVDLISPYGGDREEYASTNINDAALLRHFGIMIMDGKPVFDGFYHLRVG